MSDFPRSILAFQRQFPDEAACAAWLSASRWPDGFCCPSCGHGKGWKLATRAFTWECAGCGKQTSVTAGIVMHGSKLPLSVWFWAAYLMATHSDGISGGSVAAVRPRAYKSAGSRAPSCAGRWSIPPAPCCRVWSRSTKCTCPTAPRMTRWRADTGEARTARCRSSSPSRSSKRLPDACAGGRRAVGQPSPVRQGQC